MKLPLAVCPSCGSENNAASAIGDDDRARPKPGDVWLCINCGLVALYGNDLLPRSIRRDELKDVPPAAMLASTLIIERGRIR